LPFARPFNLIAAIREAYQRVSFRQAQEMASDEAEIVVGERVEWAPVVCVQDAPVLGWGADSLDGRRGYC